MKVVESYPGTAGEEDWRCRGCGRRRGRKEGHRSFASAVSTVGIERSPEESKDEEQLHPPTTKTRPRTRRDAGATHLLWAIWRPGYAEPLFELSQVQRP